MADQWEAGSLDQKFSDEARGTIRMLEEIADLPLSTIRRFYLGEEE